MALLASCSSLYYVSPDAYFAFKSASDKSKTEYQALHGNVAAAKRLAMYYEFVEDDKRTAIYWYRVAASYGDKIAKDTVSKLTKP